MAGCLMGFSLYKPLMASRHHCIRIGTTSVSFTCARKAQSASGYGQHSDPGYSNLSLSQCWSSYAIRPMPSIAATHLVSDARNLDVESSQREDYRPHLL